MHAGALHKPDIARFPAEDFVQTNIHGTLNLLEASAAAGVRRFVFTSTTSLMISQGIRDEVAGTTAWLDETAGPLEPRNIYGVTKLAAEGLCRIYSLEHGLNCVILRTSRFFPEDDDTHRNLSGPNLKANEFLYRRLTARDAAAAHVRALEAAPDVGFGVFVISAPTPFTPLDAEVLRHDAASVVRRCFPEAAELYARRNWTLPDRIGRVYDSRKAEKVLGFRCETDFASVLDALRHGRELPFDHDPAYVSPSDRRLAS